MRPAVYQPPAYDWDAHRRGEAPNVFRWIISQVPELRANREMAETLHRHQRLAVEWRRR